MLNKLLIVFLLITINSALFSFSVKQFKENTNIENNTIYMIKLINGDIISANIIEIVSSIDQVKDILNQNTITREQVDNFVPFIIIKAFEEEIFIYEDEIMNISIRTNNNNTYQKQNHSLFLMPTANPISNNHFIGSYELFFILGGVGIFDYVSLIGGYSFIPLTNTKEQITEINAKVSIPPIRLDNSSNIVFAIGYNYAQVNKSNKLHHLFGVATYNFNGATNYENASNASVGIFYKTGSQIFPSSIVFFERGFDFNYPDGSFGMCGGFEKHFTNRKDLSVLFEIWNTDVVNAANTAILLGLRLSGKKFYSDFGLSVVTAPFVAPFFSFVWMPFGR